jgi:predicted transcriptional regulator
MSPQRNPNPRHVCVRLRPEMVARVDALADSLMPSGARRGRSEVLRAAIRAGLPIVEAERKNDEIEPRKASG